MRASSLQACVFVQTPSSKVFVFDGSGNPIDIQTDQLTDREAAAFMAMQDAFNLATERNGSFSYQNYICPWDWSTNNAVMAQNGLFTFPTAIITASYPDGREKQYILGKEFIDKLTGGIWTAEKIYPYIKILLTDVTPKQSDTTFLCKLAPPLCSLAGWMWFALAAGTTIKAMNSKGVKKIAWGAGSALLWNEWIGRGGLSTVGIGKYYDDVTIKPGSRVDSYWKGLKPNPKQYGVENYDSKHFLSVPDAIQNFKLYSIEFGNWLNQEERLNFMYATMVTLRDMAQVVGSVQAGMGFKKKLSLAFGSRGKGGFAAAFYQPGYKVINLTKTQGKGTFCHEYGHAVDDQLGWHSGGRSVRKQPDYNGKRRDSAAWLFETVLDGVLWNKDGSPSRYQNWLERQGEYYNRRAEIWARICETYFLMRFNDLGIHNTWGVRHGADLPSQDLVKKVAPQIKRIFQLATKTR